MKISYEELIELLNNPRHKNLSGLDLSEADLSEADLSKTTGMVAVFKLIVEGFTIDLNDVGACFGTDMKLGHHGLA